MKKRILFVDDEPVALETIKTQIKECYPELEAVYATSGAVALELLAESAFEVVVTDFQMPEIDGCKLLQTIMQQWPETIRVITADADDKAQVMRVTKSTHRFLDKPLDVAVLKGIIERSHRFQDVLRNKTLVNLATGISKLPSFPPLYLQILKELQSSDCSLKRVGEMVAEDVALTAKVLQVVNSAYFGLARRVVTPQQAVNLIGLDTLRALVVYTYAFANFKVDPRLLEVFSVKRLSQHSLLVGKLAQALSREEVMDKSLEEEALIAGILHDIGKLVLIQSPDQYLEAANYSQIQHCDIYQAEYEIFGASHAEVGAYLLGLWGIPEPVVLAVAFHHNPAKLLDSGFTALTTVHVANAFVGGGTGSFNEIPGLDVHYLLQIEKQDQVQKWLGVYRKVLAEQAELY